MPTNSATPPTPTFNRDVHAAAHTLPDRFIQCRDLGHTWKLGGTITRDSSGFYRRPLKCVACRTLRIDKMSPAGFIYGRSYQYPDGYQLPGLGHAVHNRTAFRRVMLERTSYLDLDE